MDNPLEFLAPEGEAENAPAVEAEAPPETTTAEGKPEAISAEPRHVPISAMLDEREKRQALEKQLAAFKARPEPGGAPPITDPAVEARLYAMNRDFSRRLAARQYGAETVAKVHDWAAAKCDEDPIFNQQLLTSDDPYESAMAAYKREEVLAKVNPDDLDEYTAWKAAKAQAGQAQPLQQQPPQTPPPRSLANASGTGAAGRPHVPVGEGEAFNSLFKG